MKKITLIALGLLLGVGFSAEAATILFGNGGGTGIGTASAGDVGKYLKVSDDSPFTYTFDTPAGGSGGWPFTPDTNYGVPVQSTTTPEWFKNGLMASSTSYFVNSTTTGWANFADQSGGAGAWAGQIGGYGTTLQLTGFGNVNVDTGAGNYLRVNSGGFIVGSLAGANTDDIAIIGTGGDFKNSGVSLATLQASIPSIAGLVPYTGATGAIDLGVQPLTTTGLITAGTVLVGDISTTLGGSINFNDGAANPIQVTPQGAGILGFRNPVGGFFANLDSSSLTVDRTFTFPDWTGNLLVSSSTSLYQAAGGNIGIGTTSPYSLLSISNNINTSINTPLFTIASTTGGTSTSTLMTVLASGNVGIGTTVPGTRGGAAAKPYLDIISPLANGGRAGIGIGGNFTANGVLGDINFYNTAIGSSDERVAIITASRIDANNSGSLGFWTSNAGNLGSSARVTISSIGNVGIGQNNPSYNLDVTGSSHFTSYVDASYFVSTSSVATSTFAGGITGPNNFIVQQNSGNIGIGTTTPASKLSIYQSSTGSYGALDVGDTTPQSGGIYNAVNIKGAFSPTLGLIGINLEPTLPSTTSYDFRGINIKQTVAVAANVVGKVAGIYLDNPVISGTAATRYAIYSANTDQSYFAGNVGIGTTTPFANLSISTAAQTAAGNVLFNIASTTNKSLFAIDNRGKITVNSTGSDAVVGNATLVAGTVTVNTTAATANSFIMLTRKTSGGTLGTAITYTTTAGSFTITSDSALDTSTFSWLVVN